VRSRGEYYYGIKKPKKKGGNEGILFLAGTIQKWHLGGLMHLLVGETQRETREGGLRGGKGS